MPKTERTMHHEYFEYVEDAVHKYGSRTFVLIQVGAFFEVYGYKPLDSEENMSNCDIEKYSSICNLNVSDKTTIDLFDKHENAVMKRRIMMAGFRDFTLDKYLTKLTDAGYTVLVYTQEKLGKDIIRKLDQIYSPGTYVSYDTDVGTKLTNNLMCIWTERFKIRNSRDIMVCGCAVINVFTGEVHTFQYEQTYYMNISTFDELERFVSIHVPSEVIFIHDFTIDEIKKVIQFAGVQTDCIHYVCNTSDKSEKCKNQRFMKETIDVIYNDETYNLYNDFTEHIISTQAMCYLFDFIQEHNPNLTSKIQLPLFNNVTSNVVLANHTLSQLNIISDNSFSGNNSGRLTSVMNFLNKCLTPMGKRLLQYQITHPTTKESWLNSEYKMIDIMLCKINYTKIKESRSKICKIKDIDKILRQVVVKTLYPSTIYTLFDSLHIFHQLMNSTINDEPICKYLANTDTDSISHADIVNKIASIKRFLKKCFKLTECKGVNSMTVFDVNIINPGISDELDTMVNEYELCYSKFYEIHSSLNSMFQRCENSTMDYVKIHTPEKSPICLQMTTKRSMLLKKIKESSDFENEIIIDETTKISLDDIKFVKASATSVEINIDILNNICRTIFNYKSKLNEQIAKVFKEILSDFENIHYGNLEYISKVIARYDVLQSKTYCAKEYRYTKPLIHDDDNRSFFKAKGIRHCLIEQLQENELYVENDLDLGTPSQKGVLLYGTNAVGKTSLIRAIGICVIMAQCGMYVPCTEFVYKPYTAIFSRILGNDNLFRGLSTFAVEMSELRTILNSSDENSLILGDELCSGTETESALSIFVAGLQHLQQKGCTFIFATHFHEIVDYDEIQSMPALSLKHLEVSYDMEKDCLLYDRKLKDGSGPRIYGLEVCKSLHMNTDFIDRAFEIRNKYFENSRGVLSGTKSHYNASKIKGNCEMCNKTKASEIHHLMQQKDADEDGFIGSVHKNHKANLISICEECHDKIHDKTNIQHVPTRKKKTSNGTKLY